MTITGENLYSYHPYSTLLAFELISHFLGAPTDHVVLLYPIPSRAWMELALGFLKVLRKRDLPVRHIRIDFQYLWTGSTYLCVNPFNTRGRSFNASRFLYRRSLAMAGLATRSFTAQLGRGDNGIRCWAFSPEMAGIATAGALIQPFASIDQSLRYVLMRFSML